MGRSFPGFPGLPYYSMAPTILWATHRGELKGPWNEVYSELFSCDRQLILGRFAV
jgi:hypothetical protein